MAEVAIRFSVDEDQLQRTVAKVANALSLHRYESS